MGATRYQYINVTLQARIGELTQQLEEKNQKIQHLTDRLNSLQEQKAKIEAEIAEIQDFQKSIQ